MKKILITGSSGYIGSHLCKLLENEYEVYGLDINKPQVDVHDFYDIDITKMFNIAGVEYDAVVHLAALVRVGESELKPISYYITNLNGTMNVLNKIKTKNFIFASTGAAAECESVYGVSKRAAEDVVKAYSAMTGIDYTIFRFYNVIGSTVVPPTNPEGLMLKLMNAKDGDDFTIYGNDYDTSDGTCVRDYVHVDEICHAIKLAIEKPANQTENIGTGVGYTVKEMVKIFEKVNNIKLNVKIGNRRKGDIDTYVLDSPSPYMKKMFTIDQLLKV